MNKEYYLKAALIGGCVAGFLSVIPILKVIDFLWVLGGGVVAVYILTNSAPAPISYGDGAVVGLLAGLIGGVISGVLNLLLRIAGFGAGMAYLERFADQIPQFDQYIGMARTATIGMGMIILGLFFTIIIYAIFGTLGGVIGTAIFVKKKKEAKEMDDFLAFRKMITPIIIQIIFWLGVIACVIGGFRIIFYADPAGGRVPEIQVPVGMLLIFLGPFVIRIYCELMILLFRMNDTLTEIKNNTEPKP